MGWTFLSPYHNRKCYHSFGCIFIEVAGGPPSSFKGLCLDGGQHFQCFLVSHNKKGFCKGDVAKKFIGGSRVERFAPILVGCQLTRLFDHPISSN